MDNNVASNVLVFSDRKCQLSTILTVMLSHSYGEYTIQSNKSSQYTLNTLQTTVNTYLLLLYAKNVNLSRGEMSNEFQVYFCVICFGESSLTFVSRME